MKPNDTSGWFTEKQLIAAAGVGSFTLDRWRRSGLVPWARQFLDFGEGTVTIYPPIAVQIIRRVLEIRTKFKGVDRWRWALWLEGYPVVIERSLVDHLSQLEKRAKTAGSYLSQLQTAPEMGNTTKTAFEEAASKGRLRGKPQQPIFNHLRQHKARSICLEWAVAIGVGIVPPASIYIPGSPTAKTFKKATAAAEPPDPALEIERMSFARLNKIAGNATGSEIEQARLDCGRLDGLITFAASLDWGRVRDVLGVTHQGRPANPIAPFERLMGLWENLTFRACVVPFLIFVRSRPGYRYELEERFASLEIELRTLAKKSSGTFQSPRADLS